MSKENEHTQKVFVVTHGTYSDYKIIGVFSTRQKAEAFIVIVQGPENTFSEYGDRMDIEAYDLNEHFNRKLYAFEVVMEISTRKVESIEFEENWELWKNDEPFTIAGGTTIIWRGIRAKSIGHAVKIASEKVSAMIASQVLIPVPGKNKAWQWREKGVKR